MPFPCPPPTEIVVELKKVLLPVSPLPPYAAAPTAKISDVAWRTRVRVAGRIRSLRVQTAKGTANLECEITDDTGVLLLVFQGRPKIPGIEPGARLIVEGMVGSWTRRLAILNPDYELVSE